MKEIQLTQGKVALVDDLDFEYLNQWKWCAHKQKKTYYAVRNSTRKTPPSRLIKMHRVILSVNGSKIHVDHKDHNGLNNQRNNIRVATNSQNCANGHSRKNSSSKFIGVSWFKRDNKWHAAITKNYKSIHLGNFYNEIDAAIAYNNAAIKVHGEFASLNSV